MVEGGIKNGSGSTTMTGRLTDENLKGLDDLQEADEYSTSSLPLSDLGGDQQFEDEPAGSTSNQSFINDISSNTNRHEQEDARRTKKDDVYGSEGDLLWKALVVSLLTMIGTAAGFVFLYGLIEGDVETTSKVSLLSGLKHGDKKMLSRLNGIRWCGSAAITHIQ